MNGNTFQRSLIDDKRLELRKGPGMECCALRPASLHPRANVREIFKRNRPLRAFGLRNNPFGETVVDMFSKSALLAGQLPQAAVTAERAKFLQFAPEPPMPVAHVLDDLSAVGRAVTIGGDIGHAQIDSEHAVNVLRFGFLSIARYQQIPVAAMIEHFALTLPGGEQGALSFSTNERDCLPSVKCPDRDKRVEHGEREDTVIVGNRAVGPKRPPHLPIQLIRIRDFGNTAHGELRGKSERLAHVLINQLMEGKLAECLSREGNTADVVARRIGCLKRALECISLFRRGQQFQLNGQFHLAALLLLNVVLDRFSRDVPSTTDIVRTAPQRRQARTEVWKLITQNARRVAFHLINNVLRRECWWRFHKQVNVIRLNLKRHNLKMQRRCMLVDQHPQAVSNRACQHLAPVFRTPDEVVIDCRDAASNVAVSLSTHVLQYTWTFDSCQQKKGGQASSARLKAAVSACVFL